MVSLQDIYTNTSELARGGAGTICLEHMPDSTRVGGVFFSKIHIVPRVL